MSGLLGSRSSKCWYKTAKVVKRSNRLLSKEIKGEGVQGIEIKGELRITGRRNMGRRITEP
jgi:hypothetical protein